MDVGASAFRRIEAPRIAEIAKRSVEIFHVDGALVRFQMDLAGECLADRLIAHRHVGDEHCLPVAFLA